MIEQTGTNHKHPLSKLELLVGSGLFVLLLFLMGCLGPGSAQIAVDEPYLVEESMVLDENILVTATVGIPPTSTAVSVEPVIAKEIYDQSVLTENQRERLYRVSLEYLADTETEAIRVAKDLQFNGDGGHPATFCGPLSIGILRDAGLVDRYTDLHNFWLLNPRENYTVENILEKTFPNEYYMWYRSETPINEFDFREFPLYTGDFLYLYAGPRGTFEHMITVSRVDEAGRAYAITAETFNGSYLISELMLYDPNQPGVGYFYDITNKDYSELLGMTGFGGFQLWRPEVPIPEPSPEEAAFRKRMDKVFEVYGGEWHVLVKEIGGKIFYALETNESIHPASVIKVPQAMLFFEALREREIDDLRLFLVERGTSGMNYQQLLREMLVFSDEVATEVLLDYTEDFVRTDLKLKEWGYQYTTITPRKTTVSEISRLFEELWLGERLPEEENQIILEFLAEYSSGDDTRLGVIREAIPENAHYYSKRGSLVKGRVIVAEVAILEIGDRAFLISMFGYRGNAEDAPTYDDLEDAIEDAAWVILSYLENYQ